MAWTNELRRASFRGVPFGVLEGEKTLGRRISLHEYPYRDDPWAEDLGRSTRRHRLRGFLVENDRFGGGDVIAQRKRMEAAAETRGQATLVHPTLGSLQVTLQDLVVVERWDAGRCFELQFSLIEGGAQSLTQIIAAFAALLGLSALAADIAAVAQFVSDVESTVQDGLSTIQDLSASANSFIGQIGSLSFSATNLFGSLSSLPGDYGRYDGGGTSGYLQSQTAPPTTIAALVSTAALNRAAVTAAGGAVQTAIGALGVSTAPADVAAAAQDHVSSLATACPSPAARIVLLSQLSAHAPTGRSAGTPAGIAIALVYQRAAVTALARAGATYAPSSYNDALNVRGTITAALDAQIDVAGDTGADDVFSALRMLRQNAVLDLNDRGAALPPLAPITSPLNLPDVVLAMKLYGDPSRADGLVTQADPKHPLFMPPTFLALAS